MKHRQIMEAILEAHQNVDNYGETWYVLNDDFFSVVKESYFIEDDGTRKSKPFVSLYNTTDRIYGQSIARKMEYVDGKISVCDPEDEDFDQPYGEKVLEAPVEKERGINMIMMGHAGAGRSIAVRHLVEKSRSVGPSVTISPSSGLIARPLPEIMRDDLSFPIKNYRQHLDELNNSTPVIDKTISSVPTEARRKALRMKRKKKARKGKR